MGEDPQIGRGGAAYNRQIGDRLHKPNPCVAALEGELFAVRLIVSDVGTAIGVKIDNSARVVDRSGAPIRGLFAVGNDVASIFGGGYPGGGSTLGPALTFGYIAGKAVANGINLQRA